MALSACATVRAPDLGVAIPRNDEETPSIPRPMGKRGSPFVQPVSKLAARFLQFSEESGCHGVDDAGRSEAVGRLQSADRSLHLLGVGAAFAYIQ